MRILFLGDVVGISGCSKILNNLKSEIDKRKIDFAIKGHKDLHLKVSKDTLQKGLLIKL